MFLSLKYTQTKNNIGGPEFEYVLADTDFETTIAIAVSALLDGIYLVFIKEYEKRNLNVAHNIIRLIEFLSGNWIEERVLSQITYLENNVPEYKKYIEDVRKYMVLL